jgi:hypothetical protein
MAKNLNYPGATYLSQGIQTDVGMLFNEALTTPTAASTYVLYMDSSFNLYWWNGTSASKINNQSGGGGTGSLDDAYGAGRTITVDEGAIVINDATTGAANTLEFNKTGAGTGNVIDIDMDAGIAAGAIYIDNGAGARTGSDIQVKDDSTGAHSVINIDKSGSGTSVAFDWQGSYNGSPAGQVFLLTFDANDVLDTEAMQIDTGAGNRGIMFDFNFAHTDSGTTSHIFDIDVTGQLDSNVFDITFGTAASTGDAVKVSMGTNVAGSAFVATGTGIRTDHLVKLSSDDTGAVNMVDITVTGTSSGGLIYLSVDGAITGNTIDIDMNAGVASKAIYIDAGNAIRTANLIDVLNDGSGNTDVFGVTSTNTGSGAIFDIDMNGIATGHVMNVDMNAAVGAEFLFLDAGNAIRTATLIEVTFDGSGNVSFLDLNCTNTGSGSLIDIDVTGVHTGVVLDIAYPSAASTGEAIKVTMGTNVAGSALVLVTTGARTDDIQKIDDDSTSNSHVWDINISGNSTGNVFDLAFSASSVTGDAFAIDMGTNVAGSVMVIAAAGARTDDLFQITDNSTSNSHVFDINIDNNYTGNVIDITFATGVATGEAIQVVMGTNVAGSAFVVTGTGIRTDDMFKIDSDHTGAGLIWDINLTGAASGNVFDLTYSVGANTGNAISLAMGTNVGGQAIVVTGAATGVSGEGSVLDINHTGNLVAGADLIHIVSTGNHDATSDVFYLEQSTGAGAAGTNLMHLLASGANVEALYIEAGLLFQSVATATPGSGNGETLPSSSNVVHYDPNGGSRTGVIVAVGLRDGQKLTITNIADAAETVTMAAAATSNVAFGASCVIARYQAVELTWCAATSLWYQNILA